MEIIEVDINKITPDPNQPRQIIDANEIANLSKTLLTKTVDGGHIGIINPIEIDKNYIIITGERRWQAAKLVGLKTIPCKILSEITNEDRFLRQLIENLHNNTMSEGDTATALVVVLINNAKLSDKPLVQKYWMDFLGGKTISKDSNLVTVTRLTHFDTVKGVDLGISELSRQIGKGDTWIKEKLFYFKQPDTVRDWMNSSKGKPSLMREIDRHSPEEYKEELKNKVISGEIADRETTNEIIRALKRDPELADNLLNEVYNEENSPANLNKIHNISPAIKDVADALINGSHIIIKLSEFVAFLANIKKEELLDSDLQRMKTLINQAYDGLKKLETQFINGEEVVDVEALQLEDKNTPSDN